MKRMKAAGGAGGSSSRGSSPAGGGSGRSSPGAAHRGSTNGSGSPGQGSRVVQGEGDDDLCNGADGNDLGAYQLWCWLLRCLHTATAQRVQITHVRDLLLSACCLHVQSSSAAYGTQRQRLQPQQNGCSSCRWSGNTCSSRQRQQQGHGSSCNNSRSS